MIRTITYDDVTHRVVPRTPLKSMIDFAFSEGIFDGRQAEYCELDGIYSNMIAAAPDHEPVVKASLSTDLVELREHMIDVATSMLYPGFNQATVDRSNTIMQWIKAMDGWREESKLLDGE